MYDFIDGFFIVKRFISGQLKHVLRRFLPAVDSYFDTSSISIYLNDNIKYT